MDYISEPSNMLTVICQEQQYGISLTPKNWILNSNIFFQYDNSKLSMNMLNKYPNTFFHNTTIKELGHTSNTFQQSHAASHYEITRCNTEITISEQVVWRNSVTNEHECPVLSRLAYYLGVMDRLTDGWADKRKVIPRYHHSIYATKQNPASAN